MLFTMKKKTIRVNINEKETIINEYKYFCYELQNESVNGSKVKLTFVREKDVDDEILKLEDEYRQLSIPPFWPLNVLVFSTFVLLTLLLIFAIVFKDNSLRSIFLLSFGIPSGASFIALSCYYYFRALRINKFVAGIEKEKQKIFNKIKEIQNAKNN